MPDKTRIDWTNRKRCETPEELEEAIADHEMFGAPHREAHAELIRRGFLIDSGERRDGRICWVITKQGQMALAMAEEPQGHA
jgi:hypothetical protein